jgi:hypothetical protein
MEKPTLHTPQPLNELQITGDTFTFEEYAIIREALFFLENRPRPRNLRNLIYKLDKLFLPLLDSR